MAIVSELITRINYLCDDDLGTTDAVMLINMALEDLSEVAGYLKIAESSFFKDAESVNLPIDLIDLEEVRIKKSSDTEYSQILLDAFVHKYEDITQEDGDFLDETKRNQIKRYRLVDDLLYFLPKAPYEGDIRIFYYSMLPSVSETKLNEIPKLRLQHHRAIPLYAAAKYHQNWKDSLNEKQDFWGEYLEAKATLFQDTLERKQKTKSQYVIKTRGWQ